MLSERRKSDLNLCLEGERMRVSYVSFLLAATMGTGSARSPAETTQRGLTLRTYGNTALAGAPTVTSKGAPATIDLPSAPSSGELTGMITFPKNGTYEFVCSFTGTTTGWVWVDGHQVCNDGNAYKLGPGSFDNPLPV